MLAGRVRAGRKPPFVQRPTIPAESSRRQNNRAKEHSGRRRGSDPQTITRHARADCRGARSIRTTHITTDQRSQHQKILRMGKTYDGCKIRLRCVHVGERGKDARRPAGQPRPTNRRLVVRRHLHGKRRIRHESNDNRTRRTTRPRRTVRTLRTEYVVCSRVGERPAKHVKQHVIERQHVEQSGQ